MFCSFLVDFGIENPSEIDPKPFQKGVENKMQVGMGLGWLLEPIFGDFGSKLRGKLGPSWHQNLKNGGPKTRSKKEVKKMSVGSCKSPG